MTTKSQLRAYYRTLRAQQLPEDFATWNEELSSQIEKIFLDAKLPKGLYASYRSRPNEAGMDGCFERLEAKGYHWCFPKVHQDENHHAPLMDFYRVKMAGGGMEEEFVESSWGILEPIDDAGLVQNKNEIQACFVPLLAFDQHGHRLGHGKGYYDYFLRDFFSTKIGLAYDWQYSDHVIPTNENDICLDFVLTQSRVFQFALKF